MNRCRHHLSFLVFFFFFSSRRRHTRYWRDWSSDVCSSDLSDVRKAAILLMSLPEDQAGQLMTKLTPKQIEQVRSEEHTSELQSRQYLVCRLLLEKKKKKKKTIT